MRQKYIFYHYYTAYTLIYCSIHTNIISYLPMPIPIYVELYYKTLIYFAFTCPHDILTLIYPYQIVLISETLT